MDGGQTQLEAESNTYGNKNGEQQGIDREHWHDSKQERKSGQVREGGKCTKALNTKGAHAQD